MDGAIPSFSTLAPEAATPSALPTAFAPDVAGLPTAETDETREVKVKLPVDQIMRLHYTRMKKRENFSQIVSTALSRYFEDLSSP